MSLPSLPENALKIKASKVKRNKAIAKGNGKSDTKFHENSKWVGVSLRDEQIPPWRRANLSHAPSTRLHKVLSLKSSDVAEAEGEDEAEV